MDIKYEEDITAEAEKKSILDASQNPTHVVWPQKLIT